MARGQKDFTFDLDLLLKDAHLVAADDPAQVDSSDKIIDLGDSRVDGRVIVDITVIEVDSNDERYFICTQFSDVFDFDTGSEVIKNGTCLQVGALEITDETEDTAVGRYELPFTNEINGTVYRYMRIRTQVEGTIAGGGGIDFTAFAVKATT
jgi:hypothetical protein